MDYIFVDNFRGFTSTVIPIKQVNFFVGENSTGKTSILALLNLLSDANFWLQQEFNNDFYNFGGFKDIVSISSSNKKEFRIGIFKKSKAKNEEDLIFLMYFKESEDLPRISKFVQVKKNKISTLLLRNKSMAFKIESIDKSPINLSQDAKHIFFSLKEYSLTNNKGFTHIKSDTNISQNLPLASVPDLIDFIIHNKTHNKNKSKNKKTEHIRNFTFPGLTREFTTLAPIRTKPRRTYDGYNKTFSQEGEHTPYILRKKLSTKNKASRFCKILEKFGKESKLFRDVRIKQFGVDASSPFEVTIIIDKYPLRLNSVGYGISQILPVVVELLSREKSSWFGLQQPEVHLHPRAQAAFGDFLFQIILEDKKTVFLETHSDYIIDRFRLNYRNKDNEPLDSQVLFFHRNNEENEIDFIPIKENGDFPDDQPEAYRAFFLNEQIKILGL